MRRRPRPNVGRIPFLPAIASGEPAPGLSIRRPLSQRHSLAWLALLSWLLLIVPGCPPAEESGTGTPEGSGETAGGESTSTGTTEQPPPEFEPLQEFDPPTLEELEASV